MVSSSTVLALHAELVLAVLAALGKPITHNFLCNTRPLQSSFPLRESRTHLILPAATWAYLHTPEPQEQQETCQPTTTFPTARGTARQRLRRARRLDKTPWRTLSTAAPAKTRRTRCGGAWWRWTRWPARSRASRSRPARRLRRRRRRLPPRPGGKGRGWARL